MNCEQLREHYDLYALDIAEEPERGEIRAHLNRGCEVCMSGVKQALETAALLGASAPAGRAFLETSPPDPGIGGSRSGVAQLDCRLDHGGGDRRHVPGPYLRPAG